MPLPLVLSWQDTPQYPGGASLQLPTTMVGFMNKLAFLVASVLLWSAFSANGFSPAMDANRPPTSCQGSADSGVSQKPFSIESLLRTSAAAVVASVIFLGGPVYADDIGRETEAPTFFTGETSMICTKRGPLGACLQTEMRTAENDNDKSDKYFRDPSPAVKRKDDEARMAESTEGNALISRLRQQSEDNREKNELLVQQKTFMNDVVSTIL